MCDEYSYGMTSLTRVSVGSAAGPDWVATITSLAAANGGFLVAEDVAAAGIALSDEDFRSLDEAGRKAFADKQAQ